MKMVTPKSSVSDIGQWLESLGLGEYERVFAENAVDFRALGALTEDDLKELGLKLGHRRILQQAIAELTQDVPAAAEPVQEAPAEVERTEEGERRQLTVMFCDMVGSTALSQALDPEDMREINRTYQDICTQRVREFGGYVARYMGDGVLAYFGYPAAHEDDAERAVLSALSIVDAVTGVSMPANNAGVDALGVRVGIATGMVVVGDVVGEASSQERAVVGQTPNLAARLQSTAEPGTVVIGPRTRRMLGGRFEYAELGGHALKGFSEPVQLFRVLGESRAVTRFEAHHGATLTSLVGRSEEFQLLARRWETAMGGEGQVVLLEGEPGIGKSRLTQTLREHVTGQPHTRLRFQCSPFHQDSAFYPFITHLERIAGLDKARDPQARLASLEEVVRQAGSRWREHVALFAPLLSVDTLGRYDTPQLEPAQRRAAIVQALVEQVSGLAESRPVLLVFEDLHWIDPSSLDVLHRLVEVAAGLPLLALMTYRPEFSPPWTSEPHVTLLALKRMGESASRELVREVLGGRSLPEEVLREILSKTDGVPLFVEELTKSVVESGMLTEHGDRFTLEGPLTSLSVPDTLQESLMARLDRYAPVKEVSQIAAAIGREFDYALLSAVAGLSEQALQEGLDHLVSSELVYRRGTDSAATFVFKHALVQDAAYDSLLRSRKHRIHAGIARALEEQFPERVANRPEVLAHHYTEAGMAQPAIAHWLAAGDLAAAGAAHDEAIGHYSRGLALLAGVEDESERLDACVRLNLGLAGCMRVVDRLDQAFAALDEAQAAAEVHSPPAVLAEIHFVRGNLYFPMGRIEQCLAEHEQALAHAREAGSAELEARALGGLGDANYLRGHMLTAHGYFERVLEIAREHGFEEIEVAHTYMYGTTCLYRNELEKAYRETEAGAERAERGGYYRAELVARGVLSYIGYEMGLIKESRAHLERALELSKRLDARRFLARDLGELGRVQALEGDLDGARATLEEARAVSLETSPTFTGPWILGFIALSAKDDERRRAALREGEALLAQGCVSHCYFYFYRDAMEQAIVREDWEEMERYASALEEYTRDEPLPYTIFYIERARALAAHAVGGAT
ncbi:MAG: AAA family ATPase, partial [Gammaproteobacteria bacterium]|nr:AAA family ATPase [Gammaproteobacteria bacterium]NIR23190.1 AAA family ATPase [Gammaproteobacteria bacterium]NIS04761.1 AAA family ATPase [Gammaproteobacteria bacterium]NIV46914.1 AAA family ATPase [Gammaproteobacteria bacterium]NIW55000.1 AAA family ATPase [Gammaproteobacteria bacterium]